MDNNKIIETLTNTISELTKVIELLKNNSITSIARSLPSEVTLDNINDPFGQLTEQAVAAPVETIEVIKEVIKEVPVEVIKEVPVEVIKEVEVEVIKEVIKEVFVDENNKKFNSLEELIESKKPIEKVVPRKISLKEDVKAPDLQANISKDPHIFPDLLYHGNGFEMKKFTGKLIYEPNYELTPNQEYFGIEGEWNLVVTYDKDKNRYITQHPEPQFNAQVLYEEKPNKDK